MLEIRDLHKSYKDNEVLKGANITVNDGEMVALLGPSGSGKTTILRIIAGFIEANGGDVLIDGKSILGLDSYKRNIGVVFQNYALFPHMNVYKNVEFGLKMHKVPKQERKKRVEEALEVVDLKGYEDRLPSQMSGGQQQRVAIARVIAIQANVMLLDEPLSNLDAKLRRQVRVDIKELQRKLHITTIIVTHDQEEAMTLGDRIAILDEGVIQQIGTPMELYDHPVNTFVAGFLGTPSINFFEMKVEKGKVSVQGQEEEKLSEKLNLPDGTYQIGVRSENMSILSDEATFDAVVEGDISLVENLGAETLVYFLNGEKQYCCKVPRTVMYDQHTKVKIGFDKDDMHIFDDKGICIDSAKPAAVG